MSCWKTKCCEGKLHERGSRLPRIQTVLQLSKSGERMVNKYISNLIHPFRESGIELLSYSSIHQHHSSASAGASCVKLSAISSSSRSRSSSNSCSSSILCQIVQDQTESNFRFCWVCIVVHLLLQRLPLHWTMCTSVCEGRRQFFFSFRLSLTLGVWWGCLEQKQFFGRLPWSGCADVDLKMRGDKWSKKNRCETGVQLAGNNAQ